MKVSRYIYMYVLYINFKYMYKLISYMSKLLSNKDTDLVPTHFQLLHMTDPPLLEGDPK